jgi:hypothetical protein
MPRILFFATRDDILTILEPIERTLSLVYYPYGRFPESSIPRYTSAAQIPNLGFSPTGMDDTDLRYLILPSNTQLIVRRNQYVPELRFVDHDCNPSAVVLLPGGCYGDDCIIQGVFLAARADADAMQLLKLYRRTLRNTFLKVRDCYMGHLAQNWWRRGARLTDSVRSSPDRDLHPFEKDDHW